MPPDSFFSENWEKAPLHIRRAASQFYQALVTARDVESAIAAGGLRYPAIQLAKGGAFFPPEAFTSNIRSGQDIFSGIPDLDKVQAEYQGGATISLPGFHRAWKPLSTLTKAVEASLDHAVHTNVYITPGNAAGFTPHYDTHDVFILQISGTKHWRIYNPVLPLPHRSQPFTPQVRTPPAPLLEVDLAPGDLLYLPRGFLHTTVTSGLASVHVTLGVTVYTWVELLAEWLQTAKNDVRFRHALPPSFASRAELKQAMKDELAQLLKELQQQLDYDHLLDDFLSKVKAGLKERDGEFRLDVVALGAHNKVRALEKSRYTIAERDGNIVLTFGGKSLTLPLHIGATLDQMCLKGSFHPVDLTSHLGEEATLALIRYLHKEGFLIASD